MNEETKTEVRHVPGSVYAAYQILHIGFAALPILVGVDKLFHLVSDWSYYLAPFIPQLLSMEPDSIMKIVGLIEIVAGVLVFFRPRIGGWLVFAWLCGIIVNLFFVYGAFDIMIRDVGLALAAAALALLAVSCDHPRG